MEDWEHGATMPLFIPNAHALALLVKATLGHVERLLPQETGSTLLVVSGRILATIEIEAAPPI